MLFCPTCSSILIIEEYIGHLRYKCRACPYNFNITNRLSSKTYPKLKEIDDVLGGAAAWENVDATDERCPVCSHPRAYFMQIQTRSADEPMTTFYKCCSQTCGHRRYKKTIGTAFSTPKIYMNDDMSNIVQASNDTIGIAVNLLQKGELIALPTDTVYGLAADSRNSNALKKLYQIKGRNFNKPIAICVSKVDDINLWGVTKFIPCDLLNELLPGPVTILLDRTNGLNSNLNPGIDKIGIRIPDSDFIREITKQFGSAIALTSANFSNEPSTLCPEEFKPLWPLLGGVFDGGNIGCNSSRAGSTIIDLSCNGMYDIVREGSALKIRRREEVIKEAITSQLMNSVKEVQLEKTLDNDTYITSVDASNSLCVVLEAIFIHGIKESLVDKMSSIMGDPDQRPSPEFWSPVLIFTHRDIINQISKMSQITTDVGRCRAWIRLALNDGLFLSYLKAIMQQNKTLTPYYKKIAYLRDSETVSIAINALQGLSSFTFTYPTNSKFLNVWSNNPLLLAGIWTPPLKEGPVLAGMDIVKSIPDEMPSVPFIPVPSQHSSNFIDEEEALRIILNTPVEGSPIQSQLDSYDNNFLGSSSASSRENLSFDPIKYKDDISPSHLEKESEELEESSDVKKDEIFIEENIGSNQSGSASEPEPSIVSSKESTNSTMLSYHKILDSYNLNSSPSLQEPSLQDFIQNYVPSMSSAHTNKIEKKLEIDEEDQVYTLDYEIINESSLAMNIPEFKNMIDQLAKVMQEKGLDSQRFSCKDCGQNIGVSFAKARVCSLSGSYYCNDCFKSSDWVIPARIIHNWDFTKYPVSNHSSAFLIEVQDFPLFDIRKLNPRLYFAIEEMAELQKLRMKLNLLRPYLITCHDPVKRELQKLVWPREYLYEHVHLYSIADLLDIPTGILGEIMKKAINLAVDHVKSCQLCFQKGHICEICKNKETIYPFDIETTYRCPACTSVFHSECKKSSKQCPKCTRIKLRKELQKLKDS